MKFQLKISKVQIKVRKSKSNNEKINKFIVWALSHKKITIILKSKFNKMLILEAIKISKISQYKLLEIWIRKKVMNKYQEVETISLSNQYKIVEV